jgi:hypothetical protein
MKSIKLPVELSLKGLVVGSKEWHRIADARYYFRHKDKVLKSQRGRKRLDRYGLTLEQYKEMFKQQNGLCAICKQKETTVSHKTGEVVLLSVDHNHKTNEIRKLLCHRCNLGIGVFKDDWRLLQMASDYLNQNQKGTDGNN